MGIIFGTGSFTRFEVDGVLPEDYLETFPEKIVRYGFKGLDERSEEERETGWVNIMDALDSDFKGMDYFKDPCIALSWRVDSRQVPSRALAQHCRETERAIMDEENVDFLPKKRRLDIKEAVRIKLMKRAIPRSRTYDMIWNLQTGIIFFGATSTKVCDEFTEFFLRCFGLHLKSVFPYAVACRVLEEMAMNVDVLEGMDYSLSLGGV